MMASQGGKPIRENIFQKATTCSSEIIANQRITSGSHSENDCTDDITPE